jgi:NAD-dependent DNA ligase
MGSLSGKKVCFTGKLASMTRAQAQSWVTEAGGTNSSSVTKDLGYLVIGDDGSFLYGAGTKGDKTIAAEKLIAAGSTLEIISETAFLEMVKAPASDEPAKPKTKEKAKTESADEDGSSFEAEGKKFMFTGKLASMTRDSAKARVTEIGGVNAGSVSKDLDYLVVGDQGSPLFGGGAKGDKILAAEKLQASGHDLKIISETAFMQMSGGGGGGGGKEKPKAAKATSSKSKAKKTTAPKKASKSKAKAKAKPAAKKAKAKAKGKKKK